MEGIDILRKAIIHSRSSTEQLTGMHAQYIKLCLLSKCYHFAKLLLDEDIFEINPKCLLPSDYLLYFYYGGMVYVGLKNYVRAYDFFKRAFTMPTIEPSAIMIESYKKFVLVSLILNGKLNDPPPYTPSVCARHLKIVCSVYSNFAKIYTKNDVNQLKQYLADNITVFTQDKNTGLVKQAIDSLYETQISALTKCFITLSLEDIAKSVSLPSAPIAEKYLVRMIASGKINAVIHQRDGMVSFIDDSDDCNTNEMRDQLNATIKKSIDISRRLQTLNETIRASQPYLLKTVQESAAKLSWLAESGGHSDFLPSMISEFNY